MFHKWVFEFWYCVWFHWYFQMRLHHDSPPVHHFQLDSIVVFLTCACDDLLAHPQILSYDLHCTWCFLSCYHWVALLNRVLVSSLSLIVTGSDVETREFLPLKHQECKSLFVMLCGMRSSTHSMSKNIRSVKHHWIARQQRDPLVIWYCPSLKVSPCLLQETFPWS